MRERFRDGDQKIEATKNVDRLVMIFCGWERRRKWKSSLQEVRKRQDNNSCQGWVKKSLQTRNVKSCQDATKKRWDKFPWKREPFCFLLFSVFFLIYLLLLVLLHPKEWLNLTHILYHLLPLPSSSSSISPLILIWQLHRHSLLQVLRSLVLHKQRLRRKWKESPFPSHNFCLLFCLIFLSLSSFILYRDITHPFLWFKVSCSIHGKPLKLDQYWVMNICNSKLQ